MMKIQEMLMKAKIIKFLQILLMMKILLMMTLFYRNKVAYIQLDRNYKLANELRLILPLLFMQESIGQALHWRHPRDGCSILIFMALLEEKREVEDIVFGKYSGLAPKCYHNFTKLTILLAFMPASRMSTITPRKRNINAF